MARRAGAVGAAAAAAALAAWVSQGAIGFAAADAGRLAWAPLSPVALTRCAAAALAVAALARAGASLLPLTLLALVILPWLPFPVPAAFLIWTGPVVVIVWCAVLSGMAASLAPPAGVPLHARSPRLAAGLIALVVFSVSAWRVSPSVPGGDEPHYLVITQSILLDGDLRIENNHRRGDYRAYHPANLLPHYLRRGRDGQIYSVHAPGLPVLLLPAFGAAGYAGAVVFLVAVAALGSALAWHVAWLTTRRTDAAWFGWAAVTLPVTAVFHSFTVYPDGPGGVLALTGLWALLRADEEQRDSGSEGVRAWFLHGLALAALPFLHSRFAALAGGLGALVLLRLSLTRNPAGKAVAFLAAPAAGALAWLTYFAAIYGTPDPSAPYGHGEIGSFAFVPGGLAGLLFDQRFGILPYAPVLTFALVGMAVMLARRETRRLALELLFVVVPYLVVVAHFPMWWGGWSPPARFLVPVLPLMAVPSALFLASVRSRSTLSIAGVSLGLTALVTIAVVAVDSGRLAFNVRDAPALWLEWAGRAADLVRAAPSWSRENNAPFFLSIAIWLVAIALAWTVVRITERRGQLETRPAMFAATAGAVAAAAMAAATLHWWMASVDGRQIVASQMHLLRAAASGDRALTLDLEARRRVAAANVPGRLRIELARTPDSGRGGTRLDRPLFVFPPVPAGEYRLTTDAGARGWTMIGIGRDQFAIRVEALTEPPAAIDLRLPVTVSALIVRGDEDARHTVRAMTLEPLRLLPRDARLTARTASRAARYGDAVVFFLDGGSFPEPEAFWLSGKTESAFVIQPDTPRGAVRLVLHNAPVDNHVVLAAGRWTSALHLAAGEERVVEVPVDPETGAVLVTARVAGGFRPSERDAASRDDRFLGVSMRVAR